MVPYDRLINGSMPSENGRTQQLAISHFKGQPWNNSDQAAVINGPFTIRSRGDTVYSILFRVQ